MDRTRRGGDMKMTVSIVGLSIAIVLLGISNIMTISTTRRLWQQQQQQQKQLEQLLKERSE